MNETEILFQSGLGKGIFLKGRYDQDDWKFPTDRKVTWVCRSLGIT